MSHLVTLNTDVTYGNIDTNVKSDDTDTDVTSDINTVAIMYE
jgi:hypothetical protein